MRGTQITSRVKLEIKRQFTQYAAEYGLSNSELAKLLFVREHRQKQLKTAVLDGTLIPSSAAASTKTRLPTITAHYSSVADVERFNNYVKSCSAELTRSAAAAWLLERELTEQWLLTALSLPPAKH